MEREEIERIRRLTEWQRTVRIDSGLLAKLCEAAMPLPSPVGEADSVREKYRALTERDAEHVLKNYAIPMSSSRVMDLLYAMQSIGAVVPQEGT